MFGHWLPVTIAYLFTFGMLCLGLLTASGKPLWITLLFFTIWDALWLIKEVPDRNAQEVLDSSTRARTYMSYFIAVYGAGMLFFLFRIDHAEQLKLIGLIGETGMPLWLPLLPLAICTVAILFFPIQLSCTPKSTSNDLSKQKPSSANIAVMAINAWTQKVATFTFIYIVLVLSSAIAAS